MHAGEKNVCERACSPVIIRALVAPQVSGSTPRSVLFHQQQGAYDDFVNFEDLSTRSSKMLIEICNSKKK